MRVAPSFPLRFRVAWAIAIALASLAAPAIAATSHSAEGVVEDGEPAVRATLLVDVAPGADTGRVGVRFELAPGWHLYWRNPGDSGLAPEIAFEATPRAARFGEIAWPAPRAFREDVDILTYGYAGSVLLAAPVALEGGARPGDAIRADADVLVCADQCVPARLAMQRALGAADAATRAQLEESARRVPSPARAHGIAATLAWPRPAPEPGGSLTARLSVSCAERGDCAPSAPDDPASPVFVPYAPQQVALHATGVRRTPRGDLEVALGGEVLEPLPRDAVLRGVISLRDAAGDTRGFEIALPIDRAEAWTPGAAGGAGTAGALLRALALGLLGGLVLNLMPCVLPVLAIKVCALAELGERSRREVLAHAFAYTAGILATLTALAVVVVALRWSGTAVGWGFHLQEPVFVAVVAAVVVLFAVNLLGGFEIDLGTGAIAGLGADAAGARRSFFDGLLAVVLATPCSAPFLGTAIGFAFASGAPVILAIFVAIGLGLASPFLLVAVAPGGARFVPRSGPWMLELRRGLAFALLATAVWLVWILGRQAGVGAMTAVLFLLLGVAFVAWTFGLLQRRRSTPGAFLAVAICALLAAGLDRVDLAPAAAAPEEHPATAHRPWSQAALDASLSAGRPVFVYFTADWCLTCKVNESRVLTDAQVGDALVRHGFDVLRADWTHRDDAIRRELARLGRAGVPVYALYAPDAPDTPRLLPELLRREPFLNALAEIAEENGTTGGPDR